jgi:hypothetical protein
MSDPVAGKGKHVRLSGTIRLPLTPDQAFPLFTPTGEREWVEDWDPTFPVAVIDDTLPGTVFETHHGDAHTVWVVVRCEPGLVIEYARITPGDRAGLVRVDCAPAGDSETVVTVSYDLTALTSDSNAALDDFSANYPEFLEHWRQSIRKALDAR